MRFLPVIVSTLAATVFGLPSQPRAAHPANVNDLSKQIEGSLSTIRTNTGAINATVADFKAGHITKDEASAKVAQQFGSVQDDLSEIIQEILDSAGIDVDGANIDGLISNTVDLVSEVLHTVKSVTSTLGLDKAISAVANDLTGLLNDLVKGLDTTLGKVLPELIPNLVHALNDVVHSLSKGLLSGLLAPLLRGLAGILDGLTN